MALRSASPWDVLRLIEGSTEYISRTRYKRDECKRYVAGLYGLYFLVGGCGPPRNSCFFFPSPPFLLACLVHSHLFAHLLSSTGHKESKTSIPDSETYPHKPSRFDAVKYQARVKTLWKQLPGNAALLFCMDLFCLLLSHSTFVFIYTASTF